jgi:hypothetical protein
LEGISEDFSGDDEDVKWYFDKNTGIVLELWTPNDGYILSKTNVWDGRTGNIGIPGFPLEALVVGLSIVIIIQWFRQNNN